MSAANDEMNECSHVIYISFNNMEYYFLSVDSYLNLNRYDLFRDFFVVSSNGLIIKRV
jgi:hypothetical protein